MNILDKIFDNKTISHTRFMNEKKEGVKMTQNEASINVRDYLNDELKETELLLKFDLKKCPICEQVELEEDMVNHKWDVQQEEELICPDCRNDE